MEVTAAGRARVLLALLGAACALACFAVLVSPGQALAAPLGNPLDDVHDSTPISSFAAPDGFGNLTGADGDVSSPIWAATTDLGYIHLFDGMSSSPISTIDTGISGLTGIAYLGNDNFALSAGHTIYEGSILGSSWNQTGTIDLTTSDLTDIDFALGQYFIATQSDGIRRVEGDGSTEELISGAFSAVDIIDFQPNTYDNGMIQFGGEQFRNIDSNGIPFGSGKLVDFNSPVTILGVAYFDGGMALPVGLGVYIHAEQAYQEHMAQIPEPSTIALLGIGALGLLARSFVRKNGILRIRRPPGPNLVRFPLAPLPSSSQPGFLTCGV